MREWSAQRANRYDLDWILSDEAMRLLFWSTHQSILDALQPMVEALRGPDYRAAYQTGALSNMPPD